MAGCQITKGTKGCRNEMQLLHILIKQPLTLPDILSCSLLELYPVAASDFCDSQIYSKKDTSRSE